MRRDAPRSVPNYEAETISGAWYYCLDCKHALATASSMRTHCRGVHLTEYPDEGEDFTNGTHLKIMLARWTEWSLLAVDSFAVAVESLRGADDLIHEIGDGFKEHPDDGKLEYEDDA